MKINQGIYGYNFGRAFTTKEKQEYSKLLSDARKALEIKDTSAIVFDFNVPSKKGENTAIGTTWSDTMKPFISFIQDMTGINSIQLEPQGKIYTGNTSPYSGTTFAYGAHIIDLSKLSTKEYGEILPLEIVKELDKEYPNNKLEREYKTNYSYILPKQQKALETAFKNFNQENHEYQTFLKENQPWLEKETLYTALSKHYRTSDYRTWSELDCNLFDKTTSEEQRKIRIEEIKSEYKTEIDFENFVQFIASKQQKESHEFLNSQNIKLYGDCLIGFSQSEMWGNKDCFRDNLFYGGPDGNCTDTNGIQTWGLPALDYTKLGECDETGDISKLGSTGKLLYQKYSEFFNRYDGVRVDAAWQFVTPFIYQKVKNNYEVVDLPEINMTIFNIMKAAAKGKATPDSIMLELVGTSAGKSREKTLNKYPHLYTTSYAEYDETPKKFKEKGYNKDSFYVGVTCHDNDSLINLAKDENKRRLHLQGMKRDYNVESKDFSFDKQNELEDFRTAKFAEIFSTSKQFFTLPDMFGMSQRINISGQTNPDNWTVRIPKDYERFYHTQLSKGFGLNMPKVLAGAMIINGFDKNSKLVQKCNEAAQILRSDGPMTEETANKAIKQGKLTEVFKYVS